MGIKSAWERWSQRRGNRAAAQSTRVIRPWAEDSFATHPTAGLTPGRATALLNAADAGEPEQQFEFYGEMLRKWPRLAAVENTRRLALSGMNWALRPGDSGGANGRLRAQAEAAAEYCREQLEELERFTEALDYLVGAIGFGVAAAELVWDRGQLIEIVPVPFSRLVTDAREPWRLCVRTAEAPGHGVPLDEQPFKWVLHRPRPQPGRMFAGGLLRPTALLFLAQNLSFKDWLVFSQIAACRCGWRSSSQVCRIPRSRAW